MSLAIVAFHAHPDDESLMCGGTLARAAAAGHRVVLVTATRGEAGLAAPADGHGEQLAATRMAELEAAGDALGCARVVWLGYADSGIDGTEPGAFVGADVEEAASRLALLLREERADVLVTHDPNGGYGHPDHVHAHRVGMRAAVLAATPRVLQVTVPADVLLPVLAGLRFLRHPLGTRPVDGVAVFSARRDITHVVRIGDALTAKRRALAAHGSQQRSAGGRRVVRRLLDLPGPLARLVLGREWFVEVRTTP